MNGNKNDSKVGWIVGVNLVVMAGYMILLKIPHVIDNNGRGLDGRLLGAMLFLALHIVICILTGCILACFKRFRMYFGAWILSAFLVLSIGFSTCYCLFIN